MAADSHAVTSRRILTAHDAAHPRLVELEAMVQDGGSTRSIVAITDMQGRLMGKRVQAQAFLDGVIDHGAHFCTYLLGTDMEMNTPDGFRPHELGDRLRRLDRRPGLGHPPRPALAREDGARPRRRPPTKTTSRDPGLARGRS